MLSFLDYLFYHWFDHWFVQRFDHLLDYWFDHLYGPCFDHSFEQRPGHLSSNLDDSLNVDIASRQGRFHPDDIPEIAGISETGAGGFVLASLAVSLGVIHPPHYSCMTTACPTQRRER